MRKLRKGESYGFTDQPETASSTTIEEQIAQYKTVYLNHDRVAKYNHLLHVIAKKFRFTDFADYRPSWVIDRFWSKYNLNDTDQFNLFDLVLLAQGAVRRGSQEAKALDSFLKDFLPYMVASYTVHYRNRSYRAIGEYLSPEQVDEIKEGVRIDFVSRFRG
ncbi:hypothetical protein [Sphingobacterium sp. SGR-19]|uniref:hypothetical protein n=1 Tax=Sphingobacterium sp. SGR-19 TaxID=2710886 RepID=UPI0013E9B3AF|nr:hypothetical protein [Sphingobacterium sp. SGR-19]NGM67321.1 hypothetical protein [Sphingobacterium sp. SGR-19]